MRTYTINKQIKIGLRSLSVNRLLSISLLLLLVGTGCRRELEEEATRRVALVPMHIDWSQSTLLDPGGQGLDYASIWFFPHDGSKPIITLLEGQDQINGGIAYLPVGVYSVLVFNEKVLDPTTDTGTKLKNISFRGTDRWSTFEAIAGVNSAYKSHDSKAENLENKIPPEVLASWSLERFEVTEDMVSRTQEMMTQSNWSKSGSSKADEEMDKLSNITPLPMTHVIHIKAKVANLIKAQSLTVTVSGAIEGVLLATGTPTRTRVAHPQDMSRRNSDWIFDPTTPADGEVNGKMLVFGLNNESVQLMLEFILVNGERLEDTPLFDVSQQVKDAPTADRIEIKVGLSDRKDPDTGTILDKPILLPDVTGEAVDVGDWDNENITIK